MSPPGFAAIVASAEAVGVDMFSSCCAAHPDMKAHFKFDSGSASNPKVHALAKRVMGRVAQVADGHGGDLKALGAQHKGFTDIQAAHFGVLKPFFVAACAKKVPGHEGEYGTFYESISSAMISGL